MTKLSVRIDSLEVPDSDLLTTDSGSFTDKVVVVAEGWAHEGGLDTTDALEGL